VRYHCGLDSTLNSYTRRARSLTFSMRWTLCLVFAFIPALSQDDANTGSDPSLYARCIRTIAKSPQDAHTPCKQYLEEFSSVDGERTEHVKKWLANYEKALPYIRFLQGLTPDQNVAWYVYEPDMDIDLPQTSEKDGRNTIEISRSFGNSREEMMLRKAEAVYSSPGKMVEDVLRYLFQWEQQPKEMAPVWGIPANDNIQRAKVVTARAVRYYYDLTQTARRDPHLPSGVYGAFTGLQYHAVIKHFDTFAHYKDKSDNKDIFENVYVAELHLSWSFGCGPLCGMGFTSNKLVVLDGQGNVIALYLDSPLNSYWVS